MTITRAMEYEQHVLENGDPFAPDHAVRAYEDGTVAFGQMQIWGEQHEPIAAHHARDRKRWSCSFMERSSKGKAEQYIAFMQENGGWASEVTDFYRSHIAYTGSDFAALRKEAGDTQQSLADASGWSVGWIRDVEQGRTECPAYAIWAMRDRVRGSW